MVVVTNDDARGAEELASDGTCEADRAGTGDVDRGAWLDTGLQTTDARTLDRAGTGDVDRGAWLDTGLDTHAYIHRGQTFNLRFEAQHLPLLYLNKGFKTCFAASA